MDSINKQQPEENNKPLFGAEAIEKIRELSESTKTCFFCTRIHDGIAVTTRPMSVLKVDETGDLWFLSANDSHKNDEIGSDPTVQLFFQGSAHSDFLTLYGQAIVTEDKQVIDELWEPLLKAWFTEGKSDPRISAIRFRPKEGYYWDTKHGKAVAFAKIVAGAIVGKTLDDSIEGKLRVQ